MSANSLGFHCSKHNVSLRVPGRQGAGISRSAQARKAERMKHELLDAPIKMKTDVEGLWRPIRHPQLPIEVRSHYYA